MKALEFLKKNQVLFQELIDAYSDSGDYDGEYDYESAIETLKELDEAITELEALQQPKSCDGCKWNDIPFPSNQFHCDECKHAYSCYNDNFEPKEQ